MAATRDRNFSATASKLCMTYTVPMTEKIPENQQTNTGRDTHTLWDAQLSQLREIGGDDLPIDTEELITTIAALNLNGIHTTASNAGHEVETRNTGDTAYPWILISSNKGESIASLHAHLESLLTEFYQNRNVSEELRLKISNRTDDDFILSSLDEDFYVRAHEGELTDTDEMELVKKLPERQKELYAFGQFLKSKFFSSPDSGNE